jgi:hypothetical protein
MCSRLMGSMTLIPPEVTFRERRYVRKNIDIFINNNKINKY